MDTAGAVGIDTELDGTGTDAGIDGIPDPMEPRIEAEGTGIKVDDAPPLGDAPM
jgi:hypothetical protein